MPEPEADNEDDKVVLADNGETPKARKEAAKKRPRKRTRKAKK
jgi:hypothetical protein